MRVSTTHIITQYNDTPIYHNITFELVGYTAMLPTKYKYSHKFNKLSNSFNDFDEHLKSLKWKTAMWYTSEWTLMSVWFDLQKSIISDCRQSVFVSFLVVLIFAALMLQLHSIVALITIFCVVVTTIGTVVALGWVIGVLEAVILVLVVSLSFDYTLHYGSSVPSEGCARHRIQISVQKSLIPVSMAALSSLIAGATMLFAITHAFHQVAIFLLVSTSISFLYATFFFLPLLYIFLPKLRKCPTCENNDYQIQMGRIR
uniref:SSD domain-containing protein n=1 Tax=Acrobeloides nanus TaxID=290746 RepID=A0A914C8R8_9BILA